MSKWNSNNNSVSSFVGASQLDVERYAIACAETIVAELDNSALTKKAQLASQSQKSGATNKKKAVQPLLSGRQSQKATSVKGISRRAIDGFRNGKQLKEYLKKLWTDELEAAFPGGIPNPNSSSGEAEAVHPKVIEGLVGMFCTSCLHHQPVALYERDHIDPYTLLEGRETAILTFLNKDENASFAKELQNQPALKRFFGPAEGGKIGLTHSAAISIFSASANLWLLCRLCNGSGGKLAQDPMKWFESSDSFKGFTAYLDGLDLAVKQGVFIKRAVPKNDPNMLSLNADGEVFLYPETCRSIGVHALRYFLSKHSDVYLHLTNFEHFEKVFREDVKAAMQLSPRSKGKQISVLNYARTKAQVVYEATKEMSFNNERGLADTESALRDLQKQRYIRDIGKGDVIDKVASQISEAISSRFGLSVSENLLGSLGEYTARAGRADWKKFHLTIQSLLSLNINENELKKQLEEKFSEFNLRNSLISSSDSGDSVGRRTQKSAPPRGASDAAPENKRQHNTDSSSGDGDVGLPHPDSKLKTHLGLQPGFERDVAEEGVSPERGTYSEEGSSPDTSFDSGGSSCFADDEEVDSTDSHSDSSGSLPQAKASQLKSGFFGSQQGDVTRFYESSTGKPK